MTNGNWNYEQSGKTYTVSTNYLSQFAQFFVHDSELLSRMSSLLLFELYVMNKVEGISPPEVMQSIHDLEQGEVNPGAKLATQFRHQPLKGLWHKHFFAGRFLPNNILNGLGKNGLRDIITSEIHEGEIITEEMLKNVAERITRGTIEKRSVSKKLTGEWIIYVENDSTKYYLCIGSHKHDDNDIYEKIMNYASMDFPSLMNWMQEASKSMNISNSGN